VCESMCWLCPCLIILAGGLGCTSAPLCFTNELNVQVNKFKARFAGSALGNVVTLSESGAADKAANEAKSK
jgi:hypothetical protein